jgi:hypothetical protein
MDEFVAFIEGADPEAAGLVSAAGDALPFPSEMDGSGFAALLGDQVMRPVAEGVADGLRRFERLLADGLVKPPR